MITSKKLDKKLTLKKETIANLKNVELKSIKGGTDGKTLTRCSACPHLCFPV
jgi:natural product precursor